MGHLYKCDVTTEEAEVLEELRSRLADIVGVTLVGNRLTLRFCVTDQEFGPQVLDIHTIIDKVDTPEEQAKLTEARRIIRETG